ncbi:class I SAM-dependent methyltransferase [Selenomonadales bacterium OttesenSCG-928-I06]|nr:class I SAM-dependent methyltransferase [Selenomonadales bacterium OttesenSCG-928-I06]
MKWNAETYQKNHSFVAEYGKDLLSQVNICKGQYILDLGCGTGQLTVELVENGANVIGVDFSAEMVATAKENYPDLDFHVADATNLPYENYFDTVFSNAVFHWIKDQDNLLKSVYKALKVKGSLVCEFGAYGNIYSIENAFKQVAGNFNYNYDSPFFFPVKEEYQRLLEENNFKVEFIKEFDRPTPLSNGKLGLRNWLIQFFAKDVSDFSDEEKAEIFLDIEEKLKADLWDGFQWIADYRRIQVIARK